jgi:hypothetical protein
LIRKKLKDDEIKKNFSNKKIAIKEWGRLKN